MEPPFNLFILLLCVFLGRCSAQLDQEGSSEGSGGSGLYSSGDRETLGSGEPTPDPYHPKDECVVSTMNSSYSMLHEDAILHIRCRSTCLRKVLENETEYEISLTDTSNYYTTVSEESLQKNCFIYQKVYECIAGCRMADTDRPSCSSNCFDRCESSDDALPGSSCPVSCSRLICDSGCRIYDDLTNTQSGPPPTVPSSYSLSVSTYSSPYLHVSSSYEVSFTTNDTNMATNSFITSFLVALSINDTIYYYTMPSFDSVLLVDASLGCSNAVVQFIPVNDHGPSASSFSYNSSLHLYGVVYPLWPDHVSTNMVKVTVTDDTRDGFWGHAVVYMEWSYPNRAEYLNSFTIQITSPDEFACGGSITIQDIYDIVYTWEASTPGKGPLSGCTYQIKVLSNPHNSTFPGSPDYIEVDINNTSTSIPEGYIAPIDINCYFKEPKGNFIYLMPRIEWSLPTNPFLLTGIKGFKLSLFAYIDDEDKISVDLRKDVTVPFDGLNYKNTTTITLRQDEFFSKTVHQLTVIYNDDFMGDQYLNTSTQTCSFYLTPDVSSIKPNDIYIDKRTNDIHVDISWKEVLFAGARVNIYNIFIGLTQYNHTTTTPLNSDQYCVKSVNTSVKNFNSSSFGLSKNELINYLYIQVQAVNFLGLYGQWSQPYIYNPVTSVFQANLNVSCGRTINVLYGVALQQFFTLHITWSIAGLHVPGMKGFLVTKTTVETNKITENGPYPVEYQETDTEYRVEYLEPLTSADVFDSSTDHYILKVEPVFDDSYPNREAVVSQECQVDGKPQPPDTIDRSTVTLNTLSINAAGYLNMSLTWKETESYGGISRYWIYIGTAPLTGNEQPSDNYILLKDTQEPNYHNPDKYIGDVLIEQLENETADVWTFYVQIQSVNNPNAVSDWSTPLVFTMNPLPLNFSSVVVATPSSSKPSVPVSSTPPPGKTDNGPSIDPYRKLVPVLSSIIPIIFVLVLAIILVSILLVIANCQKKKRNKKTVQTLKIGLGKAMMTNPGYVWERYRSDIEKLTLIGEGTFGDVYSGMLRQIPEMGLGKKYSNESTTVFVSSLKTSSSEEERIRFTNCVEKYKMLGVLEHPFFLTFEGFVSSGEPQYLLTEYVENGDLLTFLQNHKKRLLDDELKSTAVVSQQLTSHFHQHPTASRLYPVDLLNYARQISSAMDCLSGIHVVHGDLACRNVYLDQNFNVKVADFGIVANGHREVIYVNGLPIRWFAPEVLTDHAFSTASDIWAFGVTVWEIVTLGDFPYQEIRNNELLKVLQAGQRLRLPKNCTLKFFDIISMCWKATPHQRPSFESLHEMFLDLLAQNQASSLITLDLSQPDKPQPLETSTLKGSQSPTSLDSAINEELDFGIAVSKAGKLISASNPGYRSDSISYPTGSPPMEGRTQRSSGFANPGFRRSSMKSVDLDSPSIQLSHIKPHPSPSKKPHPSSPVKAPVAEVKVQIQQGHEATTTDTSTEV